MCIRDRAIQYAYNCGLVISFELQESGITLSFTPVLDLNRGSQVIGDRSFSDRPQAVIELAGYLIEGLRDNGMVAVGKHFPGHGSVEQDSHVEKVIDERSFDEIMRNDMQVFVDLIQQRKLFAIMTSHVIYSAVDDLSLIHISEPTRPY